MAPNYPLQLGVAYLLLVGYIVRTLFAAVRLPGPVGLLLVGYCFDYFIQDQIESARDQLQKLAFFLVLLNAGFEVRARNLNRRVVIIALLPCVLEVLGIALCAHLVLEFGPVEALVMGTVLAGLGEGLVIPKMQEFRKQFPGHAMPQLVLTWAPLEASLILTLFGIFAGLGGSGGLEVSTRMLLLDTAVRLIATLVAGTFMGAVSGWVLSNIQRPKFRGKQLFTGTPVEAFLLILGVALLVHGIGEFVPIGFVDGVRLFDAELFVIMTGSFFAHCSSPNVLHGVESHIAGAWVFGAIILFTMIGSRADLHVFYLLPKLLPIMFVGLTCRFIGICVASLISRRCYGTRRPTTFWTDVWFCFLCTLPRATIQGALGSMPLLRGLFSKNPNHLLVQSMISDASKVYICCYAIIGSLLLEIFGPKLLRRSAALRKSSAKEPARPTGSATTMATTWSTQSSEATSVHADVEMATAAAPTSAVATIVIPNPEEPDTDSDSSGSDVSLGSDIEEAGVVDRPPFYSYRTETN